MGSLNYVGVPSSLSSIRQIILDTTPATPGTDEGTIYWNGTEYTLNIVTGLGAVLQAGQEILQLVYNDTGVQIDNGSVVYPTGFTAESIASVELAQADHFENFAKRVCVVTHDIADGAVGFASKDGKVRDLNTNSFTQGDTVYLSSTVAGGLTNTAPEFPAYALQIGCVAFTSLTDGVIELNIRGDKTETFFNAWDGAIRESFDFRITSNGTVITGALSNPHATNTNLTCIFSDGFYDFDCAANGSITLTAGSATVPQLNYVYIDKADKTLKVSTTEFPSTEHTKIAKVALLTAALTQTYGALRNQNINDHIKSDSDNGHLLHIAERMRQLNAQWSTGVAATLSGTTTNVYIATTEGKVWQMHKQTFPATDMSTGDDVHVVNDNTAPYRTTSNLNDIDAYSDGSSWNNEWASIVVWGIANKTGEESHVMINLPSAGYNSEADAIADADGYANYNIPDIFKGVGFLIARFTIRVSGSTFTYNGGSAYQDLRGFFPNNTAGSGGGGGGVTDFLSLSDTPSSFTANRRLRVNSGGTALEFVDETEAIMLAVSDETTDLTVGTGKITFRMPYAFTLTGVRASVTTAPTGAALTVDINEGGTTILSTKLTIDAGEKTSTTAATPAVISDSALADDAEITIDIDVIGSTVAGAGLKVMLLGRRT